MTHRAAAIALTSLTAALCGVIDTAFAQEESALPAEAVSSGSELMSHDKEDRLYELVGVSEDASRPRPVYMLIPSLSKSEEGASMLRTAEGRATKAAKWVVYMNRMGGTYQPALVNDASQNRSSIPRQPSQIRPWNVSEQGWQQVMTCMRDMFRNFDVEITDIDPGNVPHIESVVAGLPQNVGINIAGVAGVSPFTEDCSVIPNSIVYTFAEVLGNDYQVICEVAAQEVAHSFGLDHQFLCEDPMTYLSGCGAKTFQNIDAQCGEDQPRLCECGQQTQNSVRMLNERIGPADLVEPTLQFLAPQDRAVLTPGFQVEVNATDNIAISKVELYISGTLAGTLTAAPWVFNTPSSLSNGIYDVETRAYDSKNVTVEKITVTVNDGSGSPIVDTTNGLSSDDATTVTGGCSVGGRTSSGVTLLLVGLAALLATRRRQA